MSDSRRRGCGTDTPKALVLCQGVVITDNYDVHENLPPAQHLRAHRVIGELAEFGRTVGSRNERGLIQAPVTVNGQP